MKQKIVMGGIIPEKRKIWSDYGFKDKKVINTTTAKKGITLPESLYAEFATIHTEVESNGSKAVLDFVKKYGFIGEGKKFDLSKLDGVQFPHRFTPATSEESENISFILRESQKINLLMEIRHLRSKLINALRDNNPISEKYRVRLARSLANLYNKKLNLTHDDKSHQEETVKLGIHKFDNKSSEEIAVKAGTDLRDVISAYLVELQLFFAYDNTNIFSDAELTVRYSTLLEIMYLQMASDFASGAGFTICPGCNVPVKQNSKGKKGHTKCLGRIRTKRMELRLLQEATSEIPTHEWPVKVQRIKSIIDSKDRRQLSTKKIINLLLECEVSINDEVIASDKQSTIAACSEKEKQLKNIVR